jgi:hypothetical protein
MMRRRRGEWRGTGETKTNAMTRGGGGEEYLFFDQTIIYKLHRHYYGLVI